ncbi:MAG: hypothetical protein RMI79_01215 [Nitrososphaerota archaeon]|nr:hypothetical protein [Nitrososphaerota archaeon]
MKPSRKSLKETRMKYLDIKWKSMAGMGDNVIHKYTTENFFQCIKGFGVVYKKQEPHASF